MRYLILIHSNPTFGEIWEDLSDEERMAFGKGHMALTEELDASGEHVVSEGLADPSEAKCVRVRDGQVLTTDGPYAEAKEHLVGFYLVECPSMERALELAARVPDARYADVEVRPILDLNFLET